MSDVAGMNSSGGDAMRNGGELPMEYLQAIGHLFDESMSTGVRVRWSDDNILVAPIPIAYHQMTEDV